jgi:hypothetical protein
MPDMANHARVTCVPQGCITRPSSSASWELECESGLCCPSHFPCDWGITPVDSDDHIRGFCISEARWTASQNGKENFKH